MSFLNRVSEMASKVVSFGSLPKTGRSKASTETLAIGEAIAKFYKDCQTTGEVQIYPLSWDPTQAWEKIRVHRSQKHEPVQPLDPSTPVSPDKIRFVCYSDTHSRTKFIDPAKVPPGDVLLHGGDFTMVGQPEEVHEFNKWLGALPYTHKIVIAGNHDLMFEADKLESDWGNFGLRAEKVEQQLSTLGVSHVRELLTNCTYLEDAGTSVCGLSVYGSPWQPMFGNWAYNLPRGQACLDAWSLIPDGVDVLMTHGPPIGHGDLCRSGQRAGCVELLHTIQMRVKPKYHIFGHIHEAAGVSTDGATTYINACSCDLRYRPDNPPVVFDLPIPEGHSKAELTEKLTVTSYRGQNVERTDEKTDERTESAEEEKTFDIDEEDRELIEPYL